jgi:hypothetical protein
MKRTIGIMRALSMLAGAVAFAAVCSMPVGASALQAQASGAPVEAVGERSIPFWRGGPAHVHVRGVPLDRSWQAIDDVIASPTIWLVRSRRSRPTPARCGGGVVGRAPGRASARAPPATRGRA